MNKKNIILCLICIYVGLLPAQSNYKISLEFIYDSIFVLEGEYFAVRENNLWGVVKQNKIIVPCKYENIDAFGDGVITIIENQKAGFIDLEGNTISEPQYLLEPNYKTTDKSPLNIFANGSALVYNGERFLLLGKNGKPLVGEDTEILSKMNNTVIYRKNSAYGLMDAMGNILTEPKYLQIQPIIEGELYAYIGQRDGARVWGLLNEKGEVKSYAYFDELQLVNKGDRFYVKAFMPSGKQALFDRKGNLLFQPLYQSIEPTIYANYFDITENLKHGIVGLDYVLYVPAVYDQVQVNTLKEDTFFVAVNDGVSFVLDKSNKLRAHYEGNITGFISYDEQEVIFVADSFLNYGVMSSLKGWLIPPCYIDVLGCVNNNILCKKDKKWGALNYLTAEETIPFEYNKIKISSIRSFVVFYDGKKNSMLLNDKNEKQIFPKVKKLLVFSNYIEYQKGKSYTRLYAFGQEKKTNYLNIGQQQDNILTVRDKEGWTYVKANDFTPLTNKHFDHVSMFIDNQALVVKDNQLLVIDTNYNTIQTLLVANKVNLHTAVLILTTANKRNEPFVILNMDGKYGVISIKQK